MENDYRDDPDDVYGVREPRAVGSSRSRRSPWRRRIQILFVALVVGMILITIVLSIVQAVKNDNGGTYLLLGLCLVGFAAIEIIMIIFTRRGDLPKGKTWFLYFVGFLVMLEAIFTDVLLYQ